MRAENQVHPLNQLLPSSNKVAMKHLFCSGMNYGNHLDKLHELVNKGLGRGFTDGNNFDVVRNFGVTPSITDQLKPVYLSSCRFKHGHFKDSLHAQSWSSTYLLTFASRPNLCLHGCLNQSLRKKLNFVFEQRVELVWSSRHKCGKVGQGQMRAHTLACWLLYIGLTAFRRNCKRNMHICRHHMCGNVGEGHIAMQSWTRTNESAHIGLAALHWPADCFTEKF